MMSGRACPVATFSRALRDGNTSRPLLLVPSAFAGPVTSFAGGTGVPEALVYRSARGDNNDGLEARPDDDVDVVRGGGAGP